jgi:hypothetical protein
MKIEKSTLDIYYRDGIECTLTNPNKLFKVGKGQSINLLFQKMKNGKIQVYSILKNPVYQQSFTREEMYNHINPVNEDSKDLITYLTE